MHKCHLVLMTIPYSMVLNHDLLEVGLIRGLNLGIYTLDQVLILPVIAWYCEQSAIIPLLWFFYFKKGKS